MTHRPGFTGSPLDRADRLRHDVEAFNGLLNDWRGRLLGMSGLDPQLDADGSLVWHSMAQAPLEAEFILLGLIEERPHFAMLVDGDSTPIRSPALWQALSLLPAEEAAIYGAARSVIDWHNANRYCGRCGGTTKVFRAGWGRRCSACETEHFPRTDPVVIMLAEHEGKALVGRQSRFPPGNYSALAGFLEPGESIEEAVRRELNEEAGITTGAVRYLTSQPWPFGGSQLMIACVAETIDPTITLDTNELEDVMWVTREEARAALAGEESAPFRAPPPFAIAHSLLRHWAA
ncbi:MAG: NAD(+) diphosphatase [Sphingomonadales bacterium]|nr:NAD(+) diphosphatase [Sphingomonadales bacterium]